MSNIRKPGIPTTSQFDSQTAQVLSALKENVEIITGVRGGALQQLTASASTTEIIAKINAIIARLNATGT